MSNAFTGAWDTVGVLSNVNLGSTSTKHRIFRYVWNHPGAKQKDIARALHLSLGNVEVTMSRLRKMGDLSRRCPECFLDKLLNGVCQSCGFEPTAPNVPVEFRFDEQSPTNSLHAGTPWARS